MNFSSMLKRFRAADVLVAIRAAVNEPTPRGYTRAQFDPWFQADSSYATAELYAPKVVPA